MVFPLNVLGVPQEQKGISVYLFIAEQNAFISLKPDRILIRRQNIYNGSELKHIYSE